MYHPYILHEKRCYCCNLLCLLLSVLTASACCAAEAASFALCWAAKSLGLLPRGVPSKDPLVPPSWSMVMLISSSFAASTSCVACGVTAAAGGGGGESVSYYIYTYHVLHATGGCGATRICAATCTIWEVGFLTNIRSTFVLLYCYGNIVQKQQQRAVHAGSLSVSELGRNMETGTQRTANPVHTAAAAV